MKSRKELKEMAKTQLGHGIFARPWLGAVVFVLIYAAIYLCTITIIGAIILFVIGGALLVGYHRAFLDLARGVKDKVDLEAMGEGFRDISGTFLICLLQEIFVFLWSLLLIVPGIIKHYAYSLAYYIYCDEKGKSVTYYLKKSDKMMKGHKWQLFVMELSFIGWYIVGTLCLGVGVLWVSAYENLTRANFYKEIKENYKEEDEEEDDDHNREAAETVEGKVVA